MLNVRNSYVTLVTTLTLQIAKVTFFLLVRNKHPQFAPVSNTTEWVSMSIPDKRINSFGVKKYIKVQFAPENN